MGKLKNIGDFSNATPASAITSEQIALANRFEERRKREELARHSVPANPYMQAKIAKLFRDLSASIAPPKRPERYQVDTEPCRQLTVEEVAELYAKNPVTLSERAKATL